MSLDSLFTGKAGIPKIAGRGPGSGKFTPIEGKAVRIRIMPGKYEYVDGTNQELLFRISHWNNKKRRSHWCSSQWTLNSEGRLDRKPGSKCIGCHLALDQNERYVSVSVKFIATVLVCDTYHLVSENFKGEPLGVNDKGEQKYMKLLCEGENCPYCAKGYEKTWGRKVRWEIPRTYLDSLRTFVRSKRKHCGNCGSKPDPDTGEGGLITIGLTCPQCSHQVIVQDPSIAEELAKARSRCPKCGSTVKYEEELLCDNCDNPRRPQIFDMDLWVMRTGKQPNYSLVISDYKIGSVSKKALSEIHDAETPLPLAEIAEPMPLSAQCALHEIANPYEDVSNQIGEY